MWLSLAKCAHLGYGGASRRLELEHGFEQRDGRFGREIVELAQRLGLDRRLDLAHRVAHLLDVDPVERRLGRAEHGEYDA